MLNKYNVISVDSKSLIWNQEDTWWTWGQQTGRLSKSAQETSKIWPRLLASKWYKICTRYAITWEPSPIIVFKSIKLHLFFSTRQVNVEDINQLLAYHEVFGKLQSEIAAGTTLVGSTVPTQTVTTIQNGTPIVQQVQLNKFDIKSSDGEATPGPSASPVSVGSHACEICGKIFQFRYQLIVHRRYHTERKPFTCQVYNVMSHLCMQFIWNIQIGCIGCVTISGMRQSVLECKRSNTSRQMSSRWIHVHLYCLLSRLCECAFARTSYEETCHWQTVQLHGLR